MDDPLQWLVRELRREKCPQAVLDQVAQRIARDASVPGRSRHPFLWAIASVLVFAALAVWQWPYRRDPQITAAAMTPADRALVVQQTKGTLVYIGHALIEAVNHTENAILNEAVPPLRNGFLTAKNKVTNSI